MTGVFVRDRQGGKTYALVDWVLMGSRTDSYPFWDRVVLVHSIQEAMRLRDVYPALDYNQVYSFDEWQNARLGTKRVLIAVDNVDLILGSMLQGHRLAAISVTGTSV